MKLFLKKHWKKILLINILGIIALFVFFSRRSSIQQTPTPPTFPFPSSSPMPSQIPFELIDVFPNPGPNTIAIPNLALQFTFSKPIDPTSVLIDITPFLTYDFNISSDRKTLIIFPKQQWNYDTTYNIEITLNSEDGQELQKPIYYNFTPQQVKESDLIEEQKQF